MVKETRTFTIPLCLVVLWCSVYKKKEEFSLFLLTFLSSLLMSCIVEVPNFSSYFNYRDIEIVRGKIISIPTYRGNERRGYNLSLSSCSDGEGNWAGCEGKIYVISDFGDEDLGDEVLLKGVMMDGFFLSSSSLTVERNPWGRGRRRFLSLFYRSLDRGRVGNLTSLLLTGSALDGGREIQEMGAAMGISHLFALSGMHLAFLVMIIGYPMEKLLGEIKGGIISLAIIFLFVYINGFKPSLLRAFLLMTLSQFLPIGYAHVLSLLLMIKIFPWVLFDYGGALSFSALSGILFVCSGVKKKKALLLSTLGALSATVPFSLALFSSWSLASLVLSIPGGIVIEILFMMVIINIFIPKLDYLIGLIYDSIIKIPSVFPSFTQYDLTLYWPILFSTLYILFAIKAFPFISRWIIIRVCGISTMTAQKKSKEY